MPHEVIDHIHCKAQHENTSTGLSILNHWREDIPDEPVHPNDLPNRMEDGETPDDDSLYHPEDKDGSSSSPHELDSESVVPIEASLAELDPIKAVAPEGV